MQIKNLVIPGLILLSSYGVAGQTGVGPCHPYPGAVAQDCLELIGNNLGNDTEQSCTTGGPVKLTLRNCVIVTKCTESPITFTNDDVVRRALTAIGSCALSDYGSISGYYMAEGGVKTCYLYPGREGLC